MQVTEVPKRIPQKNQALPCPAQVQHLRLFPVEFQTQPCLDLGFDPTHDATIHISRQHHKVIGIAHQLRFSPSGRAVRPMEHLVKPMQIQVGQQRRYHSSLGCSFLPAGGRASCTSSRLPHHRGLQPHTNKLQYMTVRDSHTKACHQFIMGNRIKIPFQIRIIHRTVARLDVTSDLLQCIMGRSSRPESIGAVFKIFLEDRLQDQQRRRLDHPVPHRGNTQRPHLSIGFGDKNLPHRLRFVGLRAQILPDNPQKGRHTALLALNSLNRYTINACCTLIGSHQTPGCRQHVVPADMPVQRVKPELRFLLGLLAQFLSQGSEALWQNPFGLRHSFRSRIFQSEHLLSYINMSSVGSLRSTVISRFLATMDPSDSQQGRITVICSHYPLAALLPPRWVSQVPRPIFPRALSPITPGGPMVASARFFTIGGGLHHSLAGWPLSICVTRPNRVHLRYGSRVRSATLRPFGLLRGPPAPLPAERAISRATSFQVARSARFILAHQSAQRGK